MPIFAVCRTTGFGIHLSQSERERESCIFSIMGSAESEYCWYCGSVQLWPFLRRGQYSGNEGCILLCEAGDRAVALLWSMRKKSALLCTFVCIVLCPCEPLSPSLKARTKNKRLLQCEPIRQTSGRPIHNELDRVALSLLCRWKSPSWNAQNGRSTWFRCAMLLASFALVSLFVRFFQCTIPSGTSSGHTAIDILMTTSVVIHYAVGNFAACSSESTFHVIPLRRISYQDQVICA